MAQDIQKIWSLYLITNLTNNKVYIGQTTNISKRWHDHRRAAKLNKPTQTIHYALMKYGLEHFAFEVIASCKTQDNANYLETLLVSQYDSFVSNGKGYNATHGGMNAPKSEAWKQMMRDHWADPKWKETISKSISDAHQSRTPEEKEATGKLLSEINKRKHYSPETQFQPGHKLSEESLQKLSNSLSVPRPNRIGIDSVSPEIRKRITEGNIGREPWNKGTVGIMKSNSGSFKLGQPSPFKGMKGLSPKHRKLTNENVLDVVYLMKNNLKTKEELAEQFDIKERAIRNIMTGRTWKHITHIKN